MSRSPVIRSGFRAVETVMPADWTQPRLADVPGDLRSVLVRAKVTGLENDRIRREVRLSFALPPDAGTPEVAFVVSEATHLLTFAYLPPVEPLPKGLSAEEAMATVGGWARQGLVVSANPLSFETALVVERAFLHVSDGSATLTAEGYGEDSDRLVWWEVRVAGSMIEAV